VKGFIATIAKWGLTAFGASYVYSEWTSNGYGILDLTPERTVAEIWHTPIDDLSGDQRLASAVVSLYGADKWAKLSNPAPTVGAFQAEPPPAEAALFLRSARFGGSGGTHFDDERQLPLAPKVERIVIRSGDRVDRVEMHLAGGTALVHGDDDGGSERTLTLDPGDTVRRLEVTLGRKSNSTRVFSVRFVTDGGKVLAGGKPTADLHVIEAPPGWHLVGLHGKCGDEVDALGGLFARTP
jgi:hypothetical protein